MHQALSRPPQGTNFGKTFGKPLTSSHNFDFWEGRSLSEIGRQAHPQMQAAGQRIQVEVFVGGSTQILGWHK